MQILTIAEVAEKLRLPQPSVYKLIHDKRRPLPACKCGKQYRVREADLWQWADWGFSENIFKESRPPLLG